MIGTHRTRAGVVPRRRSVSRSTPAAGAPHERLHRENGCLLWVKLGLWKIPSRGAAWSFCWLAVAIAIGCTACGFMDRRFFLGGLMAVAALWQSISIRRVDGHGGWS